MKIEDVTHIPGRLPKELEEERERLLNEFGRKRALFMRWIKPIHDRLEQIEAQRPVGIIMIKQVINPDDR